MRQVKTFSVEFNWFAPGTVVTPTSNRCSLDRGHHYTVTKCLEPKFAGDECVVFVEGRETGVRSEYLKAVEPERQPQFITRDCDVYHHKMRVVRITNKPEEYPEAVEDTEEFPHLVPYVEDEEAFFVVDLEDPQQFWPISEFFYMVGIREFLVAPSELHDD